jgi:hypothetical protein
VDAVTAELDGWDEAFPRGMRVARWVAAILVSGVLASLFWLFCMQEGYGGQILNRTWTDHAFDQGLGNAIGASSHALGGFYLSMVLGVAAAALFALLEPVLPGRGWIKGLAFAPIPFLVWGLVFCPLVNADRTPQSEGFLYSPSGLFGVDSGIATIVSGAVASVAAGLVLARVLPMVREASWWDPHVEERVELREQTLATIELADEPQLLELADETQLLELPEQGAEERVERPG